MQRRPSGNAALVVIILLAAVALAVGNVLFLVETVPRPRGTGEIPPVTELYQLCGPCLIYFIAAPLIAGILIALLVGRRPTAATVSATSTEPERKSPPPPPAPALALRLLSLLQQEGRLIDFIKEDIDSYSDAQVGAAVRSIHAGCRKALSERIELQRIFAAEDGSDVVIEAGFDPAAVRLTGNVVGTPPFRGTLQHGGWRATRVDLPQSPGGVDPHIIAPAEIEIA